MSRTLHSNIERLRFTTESSKTKQKKPFSLLLCIRTHRLNHRSWHFFNVQLISNELRKKNTNSVSSKATGSHYSIWNEIFYFSCSDRKMFRIIIIICVLKKKKFETITTVDLNLSYSRRIFKASWLYSNFL